MKRVLSLLFILTLNISFAETKKPVCKHFKYKNQVMVGGSCFLAVMKSGLPGMVINDLIDVTKNCDFKSVRVNYKTQDEIKRNIGLDNKNCVLIEEAAPTKAELLMRVEKQCKDTLNRQLKKLNGKMLNNIQIENYSDFCDPRKIKVKAYCCP